MLGRKGSIDLFRAAIFIGDSNALFQQ